MKVVFDTSTLLKLTDSYPETVFIKLWDKINSNISSGNFFSLELVYDELTRGKDEKADYWKFKSPNFFRPVTGDILEEMSRLVPRYPESIEIDKDREQADPYLICLTKIENAILLTEERKKGYSPGMKLTKIPNICEIENIECKNLVEFLKTVGWSL